MRTNKNRREIKKNAGTASNLRRKRTVCRQLGSIPGVFLVLLFFLLLLPLEVKLLFVAPIHLLVNELAKLLQWKDLVLQS
jgi:hypothetical protein